MIAVHAKGNTVPGEVVRSRGLSETSPDAVVEARHEAPARERHRWLFAAATLALFVVWSNTFLAFEVLLAPRTGQAPLTWWGLTVARMIPAGAVAAVWCLCTRPRESLEIVREHPVRLAVCGALVVPAYNCFVYLGMSHKVGGPIASMLTSLTPLYLLLSGVVFLREPLTKRKLTGLALGMTGVALVAASKGEAEPGTAGWQHVVSVAMAPLAWSAYSVLTKPVTARHSPLLWTFLVLAAGGLLLLPALAVTGAPDVTRLDGRTLALLGYLALGATIGGNAVWSWLLRHLPASTVGLTVFLNPPLTITSKFVLSTLLPASFAFSVAPLEWAGGALTLAGVACAVLRRRTPSPR